MPGQTEENMNRAVNKLRCEIVSPWVPLPGNDESTGWKIALGLQSTWGKERQVILIYCPTNNTVAIYVWGGKYEEV